MSARTRQDAEPGLDTGLMRVVPLDTPSLGDRSYLIHDGEVGFAVDPQRDIDRVLAQLDGLGIRLLRVFETHIHNDYVTGGFSLARATGAAYHVNAADPVGFERVPVEDGDVLEVGDALRVRAVATPGHTFTHLSYVAEAPGHSPLVFTGGSLLYGSTGRPDLLGPAHTQALVRAQYASAHRLAELLPDETRIYPTHGFGSFCSATQAEAQGPISTLGQEKRSNPVLTRDQRSYVEQLLSGLDAYPAYYAHMAAANLGGPGAPDLSPPRRAEAGELRRRIEAGEWVVDLRDRVAFAAGHVAGTLNFGLDGSFATYLGWLIPWDTPLTLLADSPGPIAEAQRELVRIGLDRPAAAATGDVAHWAGGAPARSFPRAGFAELAQVRHHRDVVVLDVRRQLEWLEGHIEGATHIPLHELPERLAEIPEGEVWVHCRSGYRASIAASLLDATGRRVVAVDDEFERADPAGLVLAGR
ncbi:MBL fold metallo-hydrolase [Actinocrinis puniceicyclus]|uniref:MBL fold metallo-hydrolase n=1 Tax=Actinocrinis puniceicyclus TaxID=977794 RepID=A0A8J8BDJ7_9ACTN|nr:MBL fold metallo-hydrolase [Actinocrinis puniceicyclus]MBS2965333.1 MBL fold metallo-hydrolase [Actinocrinis puniceicyclus]